MQKKLDELKSNLQMQALAQIDADIENIRLAWRYCLAQGHNDLIWMFIYGLGMSIGLDGGTTPEWNFMKRR